MKKRILFILVSAFLFCGVAYADNLVGKEAVNYFTEGVRAQKSRDYFTASTAYQKVLLIFPKDMYYRKLVLNNLGAMYADQGDLTMAEAALNEALRIDPNFMPAKLNLGLVYDKQPDRMKALEYWMKALEVYIPKDYVVGELQEPAK